MSHVNHVDLVRDDLGSGFSSDNGTLMNAMRCQWVVQEKDPA